MRITPSAITFYTIFKLPAAYFTGVRVKSITDDKCTVRVRLNWMNKNPFRSMFWAVQGMAAELSTGVLIMQSLRHKNINASMLVVENKATFSKKAVGLITFTCHQGKAVSEIIAAAIEEKTPKQIWLHATGQDQQGNEVSSFSFLWSVKPKI